MRKFLKKFDEILSNFQENLKKQKGIQRKYTIIVKNFRNFTLFSVEFLKLLGESMD